MCSQLRYFVRNEISTLRGQIGQNDKNALYRQLGYFDVSKFRGEIGDNDKNTLCRQLGYFDKTILR